jgi:hypothetical protein
MERISSEEVMVAQMVKKFVTYYGKDLHHVDEFPPLVGDDSII